jgi:hypothetical protein
VAHSLGKVGVAAAQWGSGRREAVVLTGGGSVAADSGEGWRLGVILWAPGEPRDPASTRRGRRRGGDCSGSAVHDDPRGDGRRWRVVKHLRSPFKKDKGSASAQYDVAALGGRRGQRSHRRRRI